MKIIAHIHTDFPTKFGIPRQSGIIETLRGSIVFETEYRNTDAVRDLDQFSHIWLLWQFSEALREGWFPTVRPPRLGGNKRVGVFASRSPFRPNPIGLSSVKLEWIEYDAALGPVLHVAGADLMEGTPIYDIKPYLPYTDSHPEATGGFAQQATNHILKVNFPENQLQQVPEPLRENLLQVLALDPRPQYQDNPQRKYGIGFGGYDIRFVVNDENLEVTDVRRCSDGK